MTSTIRRSLPELVNIEGRRILSKFLGKDVEHLSDEENTSSSSLSSDSPDDTLLAEIYMRWPAHDQPAHILCQTRTSHAAATEQPGMSETNSHLLQPHNHLQLDGDGDNQDNENDDGRWHFQRPPAMYGTAAMSKQCNLENPNARPGNSTSSNHSKRLGRPTLP